MTSSSQVDFQSSAACASNQTTDGSEAPEPSSTHDHAEPNRSAATARSDAANKPGRDGAAASIARVGNGTARLSSLERLASDGMLRAGLDRSGLRPP